MAYRDLLLELWNVFVVWLYDSWISPSVLKDSVSMRTDTGHRMGQLSLICILFLEYT